MNSVVGFVGKLSIKLQGASQGNWRLATPLTYIHYSIAILYVDGNITITKPNFLLDSVAAISVI